MIAIVLVKIGTSKSIDGDSVGHDGDDKEKSGFHFGKRRMIDKSKIHLKGMLYISHRCTYPVAEAPFIACKNYVVMAFMVMTRNKPIFKAYERKKNPCCSLW